MGIMKVLHNLVNHSDGTADDKCHLLVMVTKADLTVEEHRIDCIRSDIEGVCHRFRDAPNMFEVSVFQRIYQAKKEPVNTDTDAEAAMLATTALSAMKL